MTTKKQKTQKGSAYGRGLTNHFNLLRRRAMPRVGVLRDENGAYTMTGRAADGTRRIWLAGVSAQRGF